MTNRFPRYPLVLALLLLSGCVSAPAIVDREPDQTGDADPLLARADGIKKRHVELAQGKPRK